MASYNVSELSLFVFATGLMNKEVMPWLIDFVWVDADTS